ncbi:MAG: methyl-accepting chemotaxis protein [Oscillospiraceae bacterium]
MGKVVKKFNFEKLTNTLKKGQKIISTHSSNAINSFKKNNKQKNISKKSLAQEKKQINKDIKQGNKVVSIKMKLLGVVAISMVVLFSVMAVLVLNFTTKNYNEVSLDSLAFSDKYMEASVEKFFLKYSTIIEQMANDQSIIKFAETLKKEDNVKSNTYYKTVFDTLVNNAKIDEENIVVLYVAANNANRAVGSDNWISDDDYSVRTSEWYECVYQKETYITTPYLDEITNNTVVTISTPVYNNDRTKVVGAVAIDVNASTLTNMLTSQSLGETGYYMLLSKDNTIVSHVNSDLALKNVNVANIDKKMVSIIINNDINKQKVQKELSSQADATSSNLDGEQTSVTNETSYQEDYQMMQYLNNEELCYGACLFVGDTGWKIVSALPVSEFNENSTRVLIVTATIMIIILAVLLIIIYITVSGMINPLKKLTVITQKLAKGELDVDINVKSKDEIGLLAKSLTNLVSRLKEYIVYIEEISEALNTVSTGQLKVELKQSYEGEFGKIKVALNNLSSMLINTMKNVIKVSAQVNQGAEQVAAGSQALSQGATQQASSIQELSATINDISNQIKGNAANAKLAGDMSSKAGKGVTKGNASVQEMVVAMNDIAEKSNQISKIIKTIDDIAFQTNILSINAAIEAAKAGTAGKGFAVVANEVKGLANKSAEAAKNTANLIKDTVKSIENGTQTADETAEVLKNVVKEVNSSNEFIQQISKASDEQASGAAQISIGVDQISSVVQNNSATAEQSAASAEELNRQSAMLKQLVDVFKFDDVSEENN